MRIGVDVGGTKIEAVALDQDGKELRRVRVPTPKGSYDETLEAIIRLVHEIEHATSGKASVGVGIPGTIIRVPGPKQGLVKNANSTWLNGKPLEIDLSRILEREVRCANDANCFTVSEATDGAAAGLNVVFGVIAGTGCGGGVAVGGRVYSGQNGLAGEWGHTPLPWAEGYEYPGPECYCGKRGCLEMWISGTGLQRDFEEVTKRKASSEQIELAAAAGDADAMAAFDRFEDRMARGLAMIVDILDPDAVVIGGGMSKVGRIYAGVRAKLGNYCFGGGAETPVLRAMHGDASGVRGAAWLWTRG